MVANARIIGQSLLQVFGIVYIYVSHGFRLPNKDNYHSKVRYILPFEGKWTVVNGGVEKNFSHSWNIPTQRYAYDFLIIDEEGKTYCGDEANPNDYYCYGKNVIAPADGKVVKVGNRCADSRILGNGKLDPKIKDIRGNFIVIKHADREYSFIGHLQPESIKVKPGQMVYCGDVIARCGNSGNTTEPHIHFHLMDGKSMFLSAGLPISFKNIKITAAESYDKYDSRPICALPEADEWEYIGRGQAVENNNYHASEIT